MDRRGLVALAVPLWLVGACTTGGSDDEPVAAPTTITSSPSPETGTDLDEVLDYTQSLVPHYDLSVPGGVVLVADAKGARSLAFGESRLSPDRPMRTTDRFAIGSNTKTMVAVVVLQLVEEGRLSLDDTVEQWKPGLLEAGDRITVEDLLSHRSGLFDPINHRGSPGWGVDLTDAHLRELLDHPLTDRPGTTSRYSNSNYWVLGKIVEAATSRPLGRELQERVFDPAGMETATLATNLHSEEGMPRGYDEDDHDVTPGDVTGAWAAGGVVATAEDVADFYRALFSNQLISQESVDDMTTPRGGFPDGAEYGLGLIVVEPDCTQGEVVGHEGQLDGFRSLVLRDPATGVVVVTLVNAIGTRADEALENLTIRTLCYA